MYRKMYGFEEKPFHITPNPRFIFLSKNHKEAFAHLLYGIQQRVGFLALTGEVGTGKTTVLRTLLEQLEQSEYRVALVFNPCLTAIELLQTIHREFGIEYDYEASNLVNLHESLNKFLLAQREVGKTVVLVIDEAQNLDPAVLEELRLLSNLETETEKLIQMILVGQPELDQILQRKDLRQLRQRMAVRFVLQSMDEEDTTRYVKHRVRTAGCKNEALFSEKALERIYRCSGGTPRLINLLCDRALLVAYSRDGQTVTPQDIASAQKELSHEVEGKRGLLKPALLLLCLVLIFGFAGYQYGSRPPEVPAAQTTDSPVSTMQASAPALEKKALSDEPVKVPVARILELHKSVAAIDVEQSAQQAYRAVAERWNRSMPKGVTQIGNSATMKRTLSAGGLTAVDYQGDLKGLLQMDVPAILEIVLPNISGKRYLTIVQTDKSRVRTEPGLSDTGWLTFAELQQIWFGKAILPFVNYSGRIWLIDEPGEDGEGVAALQEILRKIKGYEDLRSGVYDHATIEAVTRFQMKHSLAPDGRVGSQTLFWLYKEAGYKMPQISTGAVL